VAAAGNLCSERVGSPALAFNVLAVGSFDDHNRPTFADDHDACDPAVTIGRGTSFLNPRSPYQDRQKPELIAPGVQIHTTHGSGNDFVDESGTSLAAPHVAGGIALLLQRRPSLRIRPETVRAILMASAWHNIEGASRLSDKDGAGAIMLREADRV